MSGKVQALIYDLKTYQLRPRAVPEAERRFATAWERRRALSPLAAAWRTEIGPLNRILHLWPYADAVERERVEAEALRAGSWPPPLDDLVIEQRSELFHPVTFSPPVGAAEIGPFFEMRTYLCRPAELEKMLAIWQAALPGRLAFGPLVVAMVADDGDLRRFVHVWAYRSLDERQRLRGEMREAGAWPPPLFAAQRALPGFTLVAQESCILVPSLGSPLR